MKRPLSRVGKGRGREEAALWLLVLDCRRGDIMEGVVPKVELRRRDEEREGTESEDGELMKSSHACRLRLFRSFTTHTPSNHSQVPSQLLPALPEPSSLILASLSLRMTTLPSLVQLKPFLQPFPYVQHSLSTLPVLADLDCSCSYGREGLNSWAAQFALATPSLRREIGREGGIKDEQPYGEIWLVHYRVPALFLSVELTLFFSFSQGSTHENGPSTVEGQERSLRMLIQQDPAFYLGEKLLKDGQMSKQYHENLPYLFKVLSFDKPLPLQCHPDKHLGEQVRRFAPASL